MRINTFVVGLTGGIATGKSLVSDLFSKLDVPVVDADIIAREVVARGTFGLAAIIASFGEQILDKKGKLDRANMRRLIFSDPAKKLLLEKILHPLIIEESAKQLKNQSAAFSVFVVPLLAEKNLQDQLDRVLLVDSSEELQIERLIQRDNCSEEQARNALDNQASRARRLAVADDIISNDSDIDSVFQQVKILYEKYRIMARSKNR